MEFLKKHGLLYLVYVALFCANLVGMLHGNPFSCFVGGWVLGILLMTIFFDLINDNKNRLIDAQQDLTDRILESNINLRKMLEIATQIAKLKNKEKE